MGLFVGTFVFAVVVLSTVGPGPVAVPALSVTLTLLHSLPPGREDMHAATDHSIRRPHEPLINSIAPVSPGRTSQERNQLRH